MWIIIKRGRTLRCVVPSRRTSLPPDHHPSSPNCFQCRALPSQRTSQTTTRSWTSWTKAHSQNLTPVSPTLTTAFPTLFLIDNAPSDRGHPSLSPAHPEPAPAPAPEQPVKRGRGRPKGSKNKKNAAAAAAAAAAAGPSTGEKRKRGRPPKVRRLSRAHSSCSSVPTRLVPLSQPKPEGEEPPVKRKRGRPPKNPKPDPAADKAGESSAAEGSATKTTAET